MVELKRLKNMINDCIAVGEDSMKVRHSQDNELIMKGQLMAYNQVLGLINLLISEEKRKASFNVNKEMELTENNE
jgi:S-adenosylmethionine hydrolase